VIRVTEVGTEPYDRRLEFYRKQRDRVPESPYIHPSVDIPYWVEIGRNVTIHENCVIGSQGFGFVRDEDGRWLHGPHTGKVIIGDDVEIFPGTIIDRGTVSNTVIGRGTKIGPRCLIGHNSVVGENCILTGNVVLNGSCRVGDDVWIGSMSSIMNKVTVGDAVYIGTCSNVIRDVESNVVIAGNPARVLRDENPWAGGS